MRDALPPARGGAALTAGVVCLGSSFRGDDAVGPLVAERLLEEGAPVLDCADEPTRLLEQWDGLELLVVVDAMITGAAPGTLHRVDARDGPLPRDLRLASTHALGVADALELGRALGRAPRRVVVLGVEGVRFGMGEELSPAVSAAVDALVASALAELERQVHERALMDDLVRKVLAVADAEEAVRVVRVRVRLGALSHFTPEHFREHWEDASRGTLAEGAEVDAWIDDDLGGEVAQGVLLESIEVADGVS